MMAGLMKMRQAGGQRWVETKVSSCELCMCVYVCVHEGTVRHLTILS